MTFHTQIVNKLLMFARGSNNPERAAYSDADLEGGIGAAAVLYKKGQARPVNQLKAYPRPMSKHNTYEGEAVSVISKVKTDCRLSPIYSVLMNHHALVVRAIALHGRYEFFLFLISRLDPERQPGRINYFKKSA